MKIIQLHYSKEASGSSAWRLHNAFINRGIDSRLIFYNPNQIVDERIKYLGLKSRLTGILDSKVQAFLNRNNIKKFGLFSYPLFGTNVSKIKEIVESDIIYLHWTLMGFLSISNIEQLLKLKKPVVITMHDMWHITGGCHYSFECEKYITGCYNCQILPGNKENDLAKKEFKKKLKLYSSYPNLYFISPSKWLYRCAQESLLTKKKLITYIPNAIDNNTFKPFDKKVAKNILNIDSDEKVIAFGAVQVNSPYKGWAFLKDALDILKATNSNDKISVLIFGSGFNKQIADTIPFKTKFLGHLSDEYSLIVSYNAADVFVVPSLADNQPTTIMESLCCGTPVVGFDIGGIPDMIKHKENGYLAKYKDSNDIANGISFCLENNTPGKILPGFDKNEIVSKHLNLLSEIQNNL